MQLVVNNGTNRGESIPVTRPRFVIGRALGCQLRPRSPAVSNQHAAVRTYAGVYVIDDLGSEGGTRVNGQRVSGTVCLRTGDRIEIGPLSFTVLLDRPRPRKRPRRSTEDQIVSWLAEDGDDDPATGSNHPTTECVGPGQTPGMGVAAADGPAPDGRSAPVQTPPIHSDADAIALFRSMSAEAE